ncbi:MAG: hypothetical protein QNJ46_15500 [Leptolyngbyaceae cyanobacterium MO_188.B28]|nr:hypothetical protein [Leptolyngbyaceae cyanobacterium MO_188.B28]
MAEIDGVPVASLTTRYRVARSQVYNRLDALKRRNPALIPYKQGRKSFVGQQLLSYLDRMADLINGGLTTDQAAEQVLGESETVLSAPQDSPVRQVETQDTFIPLPPTQADIMAILAAIARQQPKEPEDPLRIFRQLQELADHDWRPSTSQLAEILGVKSISEAQFERYGFRFTRAGKNGPEFAWKVEKL